MAYPRIGVALSGGGAKGFAHVGVLKVLEEHRVPISAIAGTSIGSVIGGLYAAGYSAVQIEEELLKIDWKRIFRDIPNRSELLLEDKDRAERHFVTVPLKGKRIALPTGLYAGQSLLGLLGEFSWPVQGISDFSNYPIRFASLSADLETGQAFLIRGGNLHEAMRASMAIPTAFTPWKYEGRLLVDGLLVRNFPVEDVRALGSEVVIGVDVGAPLYQADEMDSLIKIFDQSISIPSADTNTQQLELCDFVISPEVDDLRRTDFARVRDFIDKGEQAARLLIPKILRRMKELGISEALPRPSLNKKKEFAISTLELEGLSNHRPDFVLSELRLKIPGNISYSDVKAAMERLYNTAFFETVTYRIDGNKLVFKLEEKTPAHLGLGVHYDTAERASLFLNVTARNLGFQNSRTSANLKLGQENQLSLESTFFSRLRPKWQSGFKVNFNYEEFNLQSRHRHLPQRNGNDYDLSALEIIYGSIRSRSFGLGVGLRGEILSREKQNTIRPLEMSQTKDAGWVVHLRRDTLDSFAYPTKGDYLDLKLFATERELSSDTDQNHFLGVWQKVQQLKRGLSLSLGAKLGRNNNGQGLAHRNFYLGGFESFLSPHGFVGLRYRGLYASNMAAWQAGLQFQVNPMTLISLRHNEATLDEVASRLNSGTRAIRGTGVALVKLTEIGPLEAGISHGSEENFYSWLSVGYRY